MTLQVSNAKKTSSLPLDSFILKQMVRLSNITSIFSFFSNSDPATGNEHLITYFDIILLFAAASPAQWLEMFAASSALFGYYAFSVPHGF